MAPQGAPQAASEATHTERENGELQSDNGRGHTEVQPGFEASNAYRPDFSSIIQEPAGSYSMRRKESFVYHKPRVDTFPETPNVNSLTSNPSPLPITQNTRAPQSVTDNGATTHLHHLAPPRNVAMEISHSPMKGMLNPFSCLCIAKTSFRYFRSASF